MAVSFVAATAGAKALGPTSVALTLASGTTGDVELLFVLRGYTAGTAPGGLSGWTQLFDTASGTRRLGAWWRDYSGSAVTLTGLDTSDFAVWSHVVVRGASGSGITYSAEATGTNTTVAGASMTATTGCMLLSVLGSTNEYDDTTPPAVTAPSGMTSTASHTEQHSWGGGFSAYGQIAVRRESPSAGSTGTRSWAVADGYYGISEMLVRNIIVPEPGATTHDASATRATTATTAAEATRERFAAAAPSHSASVAAAASLERFGDASLSTSVSVSASASVERVAAAELATTAALTAAADVAGVVDIAAAVSATATLTAAADVSSPGVVTMDVALAVTSSTSAAAALDASVVGALAATASFAAEATTSTVHEAQASRAVAAAINAAAAVLVGGVGDPGSMTLADIARATMTPTGSVGATMRTVLVGFNTATMQAVLDDAASLPLLGVPVFVGDDDPVALGLVTLTTAHVWFHDGTVTVREG